MLTMGIDIGTTTVSVICIDTCSGETVDSRTVAHGAEIKGLLPENRVQDPEKLLAVARESACELVRLHGKPACIGLTGQMHGMLYVDIEGRAVSPLYTWQDGCGGLPIRNGKSAAQLLSETGGTVSAGYGLATHFYLQSNGMIPPAAVKMVDIADYIGMRLCGRRTPVIAKDMAASWGCFDLNCGDFCRGALERLGVDALFLPDVLPEHAVIGMAEEEYLEGVPVVAALGDNQAGVLGAVGDLCGTVLVNIGTGSQVSVGVEGCPECGGSIELRPCVEGTSLLVGSGLCGGRAYAMLENFYREAAGCEERLYQRMEAQARQFREKCGNRAWEIKTTFAGTRDDPTERGSIDGIGVDNFCPGAMTLGMMRGILTELHDMYSVMCEKTGKSALRLVGSGNGIRSNSLLRELAEELFGMKMEIPLCCEEAACGAALYALAAVGIVKNLGEVQRLIRYRQ